MIQDLIQILRSVNFFITSVHLVIHTRFSNGVSLGEAPNSTAQRTAKRQSAFPILFFPSPASMKTSGPAFSALGRKEEALSVGRKIRISLEQSCLLFPNFQRGLRVAKAVIKENKYGRDKKDNVVYLTDEFLILTPFGHVFLLKHLERTRITLLKSDENGFDFAIRTPSWELCLHVEMTSRYNFMPLARGTGIAGTVACH
ncbi:Hypothetical predicted protein [Olea europaea subsp. europaea]|uniref:Uncharacterized protein n=1 Tax=Olea europaea subsp. europaea TaxID=158383 RepID=A0A8S0QCL1_OLEEU|nr:Hypothetical predicted protein [Olea europaea subsp. europaea]